MIIVIFFRWIYGYFDFSLSGKFPERFLNLAAKRGIRLWNLNGGKKTLSASVALSQQETVARLAEKAGCELTILKKHGLPPLCRKYRCRAGLLAGALAGAVFCVYMSGYIWNIRIHVPKDLNEYEIRSELAEAGFYEGIPYSYDTVSTIERTVKLADERISWISINVFGTNAVVEISSKADHQSRQEEENEDIVTVGNMVSAADGTVTAIESKNGFPVVRIGDGVRKGQLLISGIIPYTDGSNAFADSQGKVFARTYKKLTFSIPGQTQVITDQNDKAVTKKELCFLGLRLPLTAQGNPSGQYYKTIDNEQLTLLGNDLPVSVCTEKLTPYEKTEKQLSADKAKSRLSKQYSVYKLFYTSDPDARIIKETTHFEKKGSRYYLTVHLTTEENICQKRYVTVQNQ